MVERVSHYCELVATRFPDVRLYRIDVRVASGDYLGLVSYLSVDERERAKLFRLGDDRLRFVVTRAVLRLLLADAGLGVPEALTFVAGANGKPALLHSSPLRFNVAHSADVALVAIADGREVGVDVELVREQRDLTDVANRFFALSEIDALAHLQGPAHTLAFHRCWVRKEACVKAAGLGLRAALDGVIVGIGPYPEGIRAVDVAVGPTLLPFDLADVDVQAGYVAAVALGARNATV